MNKMRTGKRKPLRWALWHPYQGLWNWTLHRTLERLIPIAFLRKQVIRSLIALDTLLLWGRAIWERVRLVGLSTDLWAPDITGDPCVLYVDMGTHRDARELVWVMTHVLPRYTRRVRAVGFEASSTAYRDAVRRTASLPHVKMVHAALCYHIPERGYVRLYTSPADGRASSIYRETFGVFEEVPALRFSQWLRDQRLALDTYIVLLRMNIEGAEWDVIHDLVESGWAQYVDGYFGMWDDVAKDDPDRGNAFLRQLRDVGIRPFTFNDRDFRSQWRMRCIAYAIETAILRGMRRKGGAQCKDITVYE